MGLICMAVYDTEENGRSEYTRQTIECLATTVNWNKHRLVIIDNNSCDETKDRLQRLVALSETKFAGNFGTKINGVKVISMSENIGTARAINMGIKLRKPGEHIIKLDNDVVIHQSGWIEQMEEVIEHDSSIGIVGLKRKDLAEWPLEDHPFYKSELIALPHEPGQRWIVAEQVRHVMGTCQMISSNLLDKVGYFWQSGLYGLDDSDMSYRSELSGFKNVFLPHIDIDHLDNGGTDYTAWKQHHAGEHMAAYGEMCEAYRNGTRSLYYNGGF